MARIFHDLLSTGCRWTMMAVLSVFAALSTPTHIMPCIQRVSFGILTLLLLSSTPTIGQSQHHSAIPTLDHQIAVVELDAAAELYVTIERIHARFDSRLLAVSTQEKKASLNAKRQKAIEAAIRDSSLSENRYRTILDLADTDDALSRRLTSHIAAERKAK